jgi:hypothetical protein
VRQPIEQVHAHGQAEYDPIGEATAAVATIRRNR